MNPNNESDQETPKSENNESTNAPQVTDVTPPTSAATTDPEVTEEEPTEEPLPAAVVPSAPKKPSNKKYVVTIVMLVLLALAAIAGVYYWQNQQLKDLQAQNDQLTAQINSAKSTASEAKDTATDKAQDAAAAAASKAVSTDVLTGQVDANKENAGAYPDSVYVGAYAITANLKDAWIEYGTSVDKLSAKTASQNNDFGTGSATTYKNLTFTVKKADLQPNTAYYYRVAATSKDGKTVYSGISGFTKPAQ